MTATQAKKDYSDVDFTDPKVYDDPWDMYQWLRDLETLHYDEANDLYIAARYEDVFHISRNHDRYCSGEGVRPKIAGDMSLITLDGDEHLRQRRLINQGFTPRQVRALIPHVRDLTNETIDAIAERGEVDFVEDFAIHVPLIIICELMGLDPEQRLKMYRWSDAMMDGDGHVEADDPVLQAAATAFGEYAVMVAELIAERRALAESGEVKDDLITVLTQAFDDGALAREGHAIQGVDEEEFARMQADRGQLDDEELIGFLVILLVAGNETTRNAISGGLLALSRFPEQKQLLLDNLEDEEFLDTAVDELIRYVSPVLTFIRTVTEDHTYRGTELEKGDRVLMIYPSANRDPRAIENPDTLDLTRKTDHLAFGVGKHYCLGANLARMEVKVVFQELFRRLPDITVPEGVDVPRGDSSLVLALQEMPAEFTKCPVAH
jgi:cytochrome P450 family 142 subfamily A polypeptide 1